MIPISRFIVNLDVMLLKASTLSLFYSALFVALWAVAASESNPVFKARIALACSFFYHVIDCSVN
jgi:hypothetical protein